MASDPKAEDIRLRAQLTELLRRVPAKVNNGGHETAVAYKKAAVKAHQVLGSARSTLLNLSLACSTLQTYQ